MDKNTNKMFSMILFSMILFSLMILQIIKWETEQPKASEQKVSIPCEHVYTSQCGQSCQDTIAIANTLLLLHDKLTYMNDLWKGKGGD